MIGRPAPSVAGVVNAGSAVVERAVAVAVDRARRPARIRARPRGYRPTEAGPTEAGPRVRHG